MIKSVRKRSGDIQPFESKKITSAIFKAARACNGDNYDQSVALTNQVIQLLEKSNDSPIEIESIQDCIEKTLIENGHAQTAKKFILYRHQRESSRQKNALTGATIHLVDAYLNKSDWQVNENANGSDRSVMALYNYTRESFIKLYWLNEIYPVEVSNAHENGDIHIHDLGFLSPYCSGWDLGQLIRDGLKGLRQSSAPASHLSTILGQLSNSIFATQQENAGAQAFSSFDTYLAPFVYYDQLTYAEVKRFLKSFLFELNMPMRIGGQAPFSNLTFDLACPDSLKNLPVIIGGKMRDKTYGDFQEEMDMINAAYVDAMLDGDAQGRFFTFPIVTLNVDKNFPWQSASVIKWMTLTIKFGAPYFANFINSDLSPEDARSMCCRLRLDNRELRKRGGGLFGSNPLTGSIGVVTINLPRIGFRAKTKEHFFSLLKTAMNQAINSLELKRKQIEKWTEEGLYPYCSIYLESIKKTTGGYWTNHFSTVGIVGMNEALLNFLGKDIGTQTGLDLANEILDFMRERLSDVQEETGNLYNLEASPAESTAYRLALKDKSLYPEIITQGTNDVPYYTNSSLLPANYSDDLFEIIELQDTLQSKYTGGTVLHLYTADQITDPKLVAQLIQTIFSQYNLPYITYTPTFSHCETHGYFKGETWTCPTCHKEMDVYSRVTGYYRPVRRYNAGKVQEYEDRVNFNIKVAF